MEGHKFVDPTISNWTIILFDTIIAVLCLAVSNAIVPSDVSINGSTSLYVTVISASYIVSSLWVKPLVNLPGTRFYRIMERTFLKVLLTGLLTMACLFFIKDAILLRTLTATFLLVFFIVLLLTRIAEHTYFKRHFIKVYADQAESVEVSRGLYYMGNRMVKRLFDILLSITLLLTIFPLIYLATFVYSKIRYRGAVLSAYRLTAQGNKEFTCQRFKALSSGNPLNALPRLFCVLAGSMSIVGTKPYLPVDTEESKDMTNVESHTFIVKPGLTGWAILEGFRNKEEETMLDNWYARNWSLGLDVFIILKGLGTSLFKRNK